MKLHLRYLILIICLAAGNKALAQADINMVTHWYNRAYYNPAFIARPDFMYIFSNVRQQWTGVNGAPQVFNIQASEYIHHLRSAFGLSLMSDRLGATRALNPMFTYAYRISGKKNWSVSMGLSAGMFIRSINGSLFEAEVPNDPSINYSNQKISQPDANVGFEFQNTHFVGGISSTHIWSVITPETSTSLMNSNHRYAYIIYKNTDPSNFNYNFGVLMINRQSLTIFEWNARVRFKRATGLITGSRELFDVGLSYRTSHEITLLTGYNVSTDIRLGYAYEQNFNPGYYKNGTHEIMIEWRIPQKAASTRFQCGDNLFWYP